MLLPRVSRLLLALPLIAAPAAAESPSVLLALARANVHSGDFTAAVVCVRESFLGGRDTLHGVLEARAGIGMRLVLNGERHAFEWWSRSDGREQWLREGLSGRPRRLPPHSRHKPAFSPAVTFEDLARLPFGHLDGIREAREDGRPDSGRALLLTPERGRADTPSLLRVEFSGDPVTPRRVAIEARPGLSRSIEFAGYLPGPRGLFPGVIRFISADGLSSARLELTLLGEDAPRDKSLTPEGAFRGFAEPRWMARDREE